MDTNLKRMNIKKLYENNQFKEIVNLFNINISVEKFNNRASLIKFFDDKSVNIYTKATVWNTKNPMVAALNALLRQATSLPGVM